MSEYVGMSFHIGGDLPANLIEPLLELTNDICECTGPSTAKELSETMEKNEGGSASWSGTSNYGEADDLIKFCQDHNLPFHHHYDAGPDWDPGLSYWFPGMTNSKTITTSQDGIPIYPTSDLAFNVKLLVDIAKNGTTCLPLHLEDELLNDHLRDLLAYCIKEPSKAIDLLAEDLLNPVPPLPPLIIKE